MKIDLISDSKFYGSGLLANSLTFLNLHDLIVGVLVVTIWIDD